MGAYYSIAYTNSSNLTGFANGAFYDPNSFGQSTLFKEGIAQANADLKTALNKVDSNDALNQNLANELNRLQGLIEWGNDPRGAHAWAIGHTVNEHTKIAGAIALSPLAIMRSSSVATVGLVGRLTKVTRWGREGLEKGDWVMKGGNNRWNYFWSGKWQPGMGNRFAPKNSGKTFEVPGSTLRNPRKGDVGTQYETSWTLTIKSWLRQRIYDPE